MISTENSEKDIKEERRLRTATSKQNRSLNRLNISSLYENKKGQNSFYTILSSQVGVAGLAASRIGPHATRSHPGRGGLKSKKPGAARLDFCHFSTRSNEFGSP